MQLAACLERASRTVSAVGINMLWRSSAPHSAQATQMEIVQKMSVHLFMYCQKDHPSQAVAAQLPSLTCTAPRRLMTAPDN